MNLLLNQEKKNHQIILIKLEIIIIKHFFSMNCLYNKNNKIKLQNKNLLIKLKKLLMNKAFKIILLSLFLKQMPKNKFRNKIS